MELAQKIEKARQIAVRNNMSFRAAYEHSFNQDRTIPDFKVHEEVFLHAPLMALRKAGARGNRKFIKPWLPAVVEKVFQNKTVLLKVGSKHFRVNVERVKKKSYFHEPTTEKGSEETNNETDETHFPPVAHLEDSIGEGIPLSTHLENPGSLAAADPESETGQSESEEDEVHEPLPSPNRQMAPPPTSPAAASPLARLAANFQRMTRTRTRGNLEPLTEEEKSNVGRKPRSDKGKPRKK